MSQSPSVGLVFDDRYLSHNTGLWKIGYVEEFPFSDPIPHPSSPGMVGRPKHLMDLHGITDRMLSIPAVVATDEQLLRFHTPAHLAHVARLSAGAGGDAGHGAPMGRGGDKIARLAAGGTIAAVDAVVAGTVQSAYALNRPPGHHAMPDRGMGFCVYGNAVIAAMHARATLGINRIAILDWDVHHGNGTQTAFWNDPDVLFISLHQEDLFPVGWGKVEDFGEGEGEGFTVNIPLPGGTGNFGYRVAYEEIVGPIVDAYKPELIIVCAGQDASVQDQLGRMALTIDGYRWMTRFMQRLADRHASGRMVVTQEGGYSPQYAPYCSAAIAEAMVAGDTPIIDPYGDRADTMPTSVGMGEDCRIAIQRVREVQRRYWAL